MAEETQEKYTHNPHLQKAVDDVLSNEAFRAVAELTVKAVFAKGKAPADREAASCRKVPGPVRAVTKVDFLLVFWTKEWDAMPTPERHRTIVHECMHVGMNDNGDPKIRRHGGDFCEIPEHDKESMELAKQIPVSPSLSKFDRQATMTERRP
jgi:hypothetical protein